MDFMELNAIDFHKVHIWGDTFGNPIFSANQNQARHRQRIGHCRIALRAMLVFVSLLQFYR